MLRIVELADFQSAQWVDYYRLNQLIQAESYPHREIMSEEDFLCDPRPLNAPSAELKGFVLLRGQTMIACSHYRLDAHKSVCTSEIKFLQSGFAPDSAQAMVDHLLSLCRNNKLNLLQMVVEHAHLVRHYSSFGNFEKVGQVRESVLDLSCLDRPLLTSWNTHPEIILRPIPWTDPIAVGKLVDVYNESNADVPFQEAVGMIRTRDASYFLEWNQRLHVQNRQLLAFGLYSEAQLAGLAMFESRAFGPKSAFIAYTGVARAFRKQGLGRQLKALSTLELIRLHPGLRFIVTANEETNASMLKINRSMGFEVQAEFTMLRYRKGQP